MEENKEELNDKTIKIEAVNDSIFDIESSDENNKKEIKKPTLSRKKRRIIQISIASVSIVALIFTVVLLIRVSNASKLCRQLLAKDFYSKEVLVEQMRVNGYNEFEINRAFKRCNVNFEENINKKLYQAIEKPSKILSKDELKDELIIAGFSENDIDTLFLTINWDEFYNTYFSNYINSSDGVIKKKDFLNELSSRGFNQQDIIFFSSLSGWDKLGQKYIKKYFEENEFATKDDVRTLLENYGYEEKDVDNIFLSVDWNSQALACITNYLTSDSSITSTSNEVEVTKSLFDTVLSKMGFTESEIQYAKDNYDFATSIEKIINSLTKDNKLVSKVELEKTLKNKQFSSEDIKEAFDKINWNTYATTTAAEHLDKNKANKNAALQYLKENGYTDEEIKYVDSKAQWSTFAAKALMYMQDDNNKAKNDLFNTLKEYGYSESDILAAKQNTNFSKFAYNYIVNTQSSEKLSTIGKSELKTLLKNGGYEDEYTYVANKFDWSTQATNYLSAILNGYLTQPPFIYNIDDVIAKMQNQGFSESSEIATAFNRYDFSTFSKKWAEAYFKSSNDIPDKGYVLSSFQTMKATKTKTLLDRIGGIDVCADWKSAAKHIAESLVGEGKDSAINKLNQLGYSENEINYAISEVFPS